MHSIRYRQFELSPPVGQNSDSSSKSGWAVGPRLRSAATLSMRGPDCNPVPGSFFPRLAALNSLTVLPSLLRWRSATPSILNADVTKLKTTKRMPPAMPPMRAATPTHM